MFAPQNQQPNVIDAMNGTLTEWYNSIDEAIQKSEVIPGNYEYTTATSYGNVGQINEDSSTYFDITCDRFKIISLDNSYVTLEQTVNMRVPAQNTLKYSTYYIGYKTSADVIDQYRLYSNTDHLQTVNQARYEWFMFGNSLSDQAKENSDCFATLHKIRNQSPFVPGTYVDLSAITKDTDIVVKFEVRIPIAFFLALFNLRFFPNWAGKISIEIYPSYKNLVIAPVIPEADISIPEFKKKINEGYKKVNLGFHNINQPMLNAVTFTSPNYTIASQTFKCTGEGCFVKNCKIRLAQYLLKMDVFNSLAAKYIQVPLIFPIQTVQIKDFTQPIDLTNDITTANTMALKHCDSMFTVFKRDEYARTCFENPLMEFGFNIDGKFYPHEHYNTVNDLRFINQNLDALNVNNSLLTSVSTDVMTSMQPFINVQKADVAGTLTTEQRWSGNDYSNFFIGVPFADSEDFMGGVSTTGTVQIELTGHRLENLPSKFGQATAICYEDAFLKIRSMKPDGRAQIEKTNATIEQLMSGISI